MLILKRHFFLILILIFAAFLLSLNIEKPFYGHHDWNGLWYSTIARNFLRYGVFATKFGSVLNQDFVTPQEFQYFTHYTPVFPLLLALAFKIFGVFEASARSLSILFSLFTLVLIYILGTKIFERGIGLTAAAFASVMPIFIYFGKMPVHDVLVLPMILLTIIAYYDYLKSPKTGNLIRLLLALALAQFIHWAAYFLSIILFIHWLSFYKSKDRLKAFIFPLISLGLFLLHLFHVYILTGSFFGGGLREIALGRLNINSEGSRISLKLLVFQEFHWINAYFPKIILVLSLLFILYFLRNFRTLKQNISLQMMLIVFLAGIAYETIFINVTYYHDYVLIYLVPFIALSAAWAISYIGEKFKLKSKIFILLVILIACISLAEKETFLKVLIWGAPGKEGYEMGKYINQNTESGQEILFLSPDFAHYFEVNVGYYADRKITYNLLDQKSLEGEIYTGKYSVVVAAPQRDTLPESINFLSKHFQKSEAGKYFVFFLNKKRGESMSF